MVCTECMVVGGEDDGNNNSSNVTRRASGVPYGVTPSRRQGRRDHSHSVTVGTSSAYSFYPPPASTYIPYTASPTHCPSKLAQHVYD